MQVDTLDVAVLCELSDGKAERDPVFLPGDFAEWLRSSTEQDASPRGAEIVSIVARCLLRIQVLEQEEVTQDA